MNETLNYNSTFAGIDVEKSATPNVYENSETEPENWDAALTDYVYANAHELVMMGGAEMTLSDAMFLFPTINEENVGMVYAQVRQMVDEARLKKKEKPEETQEPTEEDEPEEESEETKEPNDKTKSKTEPQKPPEIAKKIDKPPQPKAEIDRATKPTQNPSEPAAEPKIISKIELKVPENLSNRPEAPARALDSAVEIASSHQPAPTEAPAKASVIETSLAPEPITIESPEEPSPAIPAAQTRISNVDIAPGPEIAAAQSTQIIEAAGTDTPAIIMVETSPAPAGYELAAEPKAEPPEQTSIIERAPEPEFFEKSHLETFSLITEEDILELGDEPVDVAEYGPPIVTVNYEADDYGLADFAEVEIVLEHLEEGIFAPGDQHVSIDMPTAEIINLELPETETTELDIEPEFLQPGETPASEQPVSTSLPIEQIEEALIELAEIIETSPPRTAEAVNEILDGIIEIPAKLEVFDHEDAFSELQAQEELEELFTELFEQLGMDYPPELVKTLSRLTLEWRLADEIQILKSPEPSDETPQDIGTHEIIKELLLRLSTIQKTLAQAGAIGKSALTLTFSGASR